MALNRSAPNPVSASRQSGFGLIEVLISLLVLAIGLLGLASLQSTALTMNSEARNRSQGIFLIDDIAERVRANRTNLASYAIAAGDLPECESDFAVTNEGDVADDDVSEWKNSLACLLPNGNGSVVINGQAMTVNVTWDAITGNAEDGAVIMEIGI